MAESPTHHLMEPHVVDVLNTFVILDMFLHLVIKSDIVALTASGMEWKQIAQVCCIQLGNCFIKAVYSLAKLKKQPRSGHYQCVCVCLVEKLLLRGCLLIGA